MRQLALILSLVSLATGSLTLLHHTSSRTLPLVWLKFQGASLSLWIALLGALGALSGIICGSWASIAVGLAGAILSADYVRRVVAPRDQLFDQPFGANWRSRIPSASQTRMLQRRWSFFRPAAPQARVTRDIAFATIPGSTRGLLCDIWQPRAGIEASGTAIVYLHGSAWYLMDKDFLTRPFFRHLAAQGHVVMDVAYRLCPETNIVGMVADAKRAVAWMKEHSTEFGVDAERIVLCGGSAGAHVALLAAYSNTEHRLTPEDLLKVDTSVRAVVSYYGVPDLRAYAHHAAQMTPPEIVEKPATPRTEPGRFQRFMMRLTIGRTLTAAQLPPPPSHHAIMRDLVGGLPDQVPDMYKLASPVCHINADSPATLLFHGTHDFIIPVSSVRDLFHALRSHHVPVVYIEYPRTDHAFDIIYPPMMGPAAQSALYDMERFLACTAGMQSPARRSISVAVQSGAGSIAS
jgi:acetyl esterase/lipase